MTADGTILIVDDDVLTLRATSRWLRGRGYETLSVPTSSAALRAAGPFRCAVVDIDLDTDSGLDLAKELLLRGTTPRIVFFSGTTDVATCRAAEELGDFVCKSSGTDRLLLAIERAEALESPLNDAGPVSRVQPAELMDFAPASCAAVTPRSY